AVLVRELTREPRARALPIPHHGLRRSLQYLRGLSDGQSPKDPKRDDVSWSRIDLRERVQRLVQRADLSAHLRSRVRQTVEVDCGRVLRTISVPAPFGRRT